MIENQQTEQLLQILNELLPQNSNTAKLIQFCIGWLNYSENQSKKVEQEYIGKLVRGELNQSGFQHKPEDQNQTKQKQLGSISKWQENWTQHKDLKNLFVRISKNEAIIRTSSNVYFINPAESSLTFAVQLDVDKYQLYVVLTNANLKNISTIFHLLQQTKCERVITTEPIYGKMLMFKQFLQKNKHERDLKVNIGLLRQQEYFQYGGLLWKVKNCCWYEPAYDLQISIKYMKPLLIEGPKIYESKSIYYGWKKNYINESNYQKYTAQTELFQRQMQNFVVFELKGDDQARKKGDKYLSFIKKELIKDLQDDLQQDIWRSCEELEFGKGQVIIKKGTLCDYVYALQTGQFQLWKDHSIQSEANKSLLYGLQELKRGDKKYNFDLKSQNNSTVQRIRVQNVKFHLYDYLFQLK